MLLAGMTQRLGKEGTGVGVTSKQRKRWEKSVEERCVKSEGIWVKKRVIS